MPKYQLKNIRIPLPCEPFHCIKDEYHEKDNYTELTFAWNPNCKEPLCPKCGGVQIKQCTRVTRLHGPRIGLSKKSIWTVKYHVRKCTSCGKYHTDVIPFRFGMTSVTTELARLICDDLSEAGTMREVSKRYDLSWDIVKNVHKKALEELKSMEKLPPPVEIAAVDEFAIQKGHKYATLVLNAVTKYPLFITRGKSEDDFRAFFKLHDKKWYSSIKAFAMDQNAQYASVVQKELPECAVVCDFFHLIMNYNEQVIDSIRKSLSRTAKRNGDSKLVDMLKGSKRLLCKNFGKGNSEAEIEAKEALQKIMDENHELDICIHLREELKSLYNNCTSKESMKDGWDAWCAKALSSQIPQLVRFVQNKKKKEQEIINHGEYHVSSGVIEGCMNKIKVLKRVAYGFRDWDYFFNRIWWSFIPQDVKTDLYNKLWMKNMFTGELLKKEGVVA